MADTNGRIKVSWNVVVTVVAWVIGGLLAYGAIDGRIRVLEANSETVQDALREIRTDIKELLRRD